MTRPAARRPSPVQADKPIPPAPPAPEQRPDDPKLPSEPSPGSAWYWRLVMFLWFTSFVLLFLYEVLVGVLKSWSRSGTGS